MNKQQLIERIQQIFFHELRGKTITDSDQHILDWAERRLAPAIASAWLEDMLAARIKSHQAIRAIHMAHDWNGTSEDLREWLVADLHGIHRMKGALTNKSKEQGYGDA